MRGRRSIFQYAIFGHPMIPNLSEVPVFKVVFVGEAESGKTSIIRRYQGQTFSLTSQVTIGTSFVSKTVNTPNGPIILHIWDTAGQERYRSLVPMYSRGAHAAIVTFDMSDAKSASHLSQWVDRVLLDQQNKCQVFIAANKIDLPEAIERNDVEAMLENYNLSCFFVSAKTGDNIERLFDAVVKSLPLEQHKPKVEHIPVIEKEIEPPQESCC